jgi:hypothetical protein
VKSRIERAQLFAAILGLLWTGVLLLGTSILWWILGNAAYSALALIAWRQGRRDSRKSRAVAAAAGAVFVLTNAPAALLACTSGGACGFAMSICAIVFLLQATAIILA